MTSRAQGARLRLLSSRHQAQGSRLKAQGARLAVQVKCKGCVPGRKTQGSRVQARSTGEHNGGGQCETRCSVEVEVSLLCLCEAPASCHSHSDATPHGVTHHHHGLPGGVVRAGRPDDVRGEAGGREVVLVAGRGVPPEQGASGMPLGCQRHASWLSGCSEVFVVRWIFLSILVGPAAEPPPVTA